MHMFMNIVYCISFVTLMQPAIERKLDRNINEFFDWN